MLQKSEVRFLNVCAWITDICVKKVGWKETKAFIVIILGW